jgi:predicted nucleic acid-binding protein
LAIINLTETKQTIMSKIAVDTNVLIFLYNDEFIDKRSIAENLVFANPIIPAQVVSEFLNVSKRLLQIPKLDTLIKCNKALRNCTIVPTTQIVLNHAEKLITRYDLQLFDSIIVASALEAGCTILYTEDMHHGLIIEGTLSIINPFI